jgi:two-component system, sensor histidine kinase
VEALAQQDQSIEAMSRLLNALLDISKLESGAIKPQPADFTLTNLFRELEQEFTAIAASKGVNLEVSAVPTAIHSDPGLVGQILRNLLSNAIKYTRAGSVRLSSSVRSGSVRIEVIDTGIGIPADQLGFIFDEFFQVGVPTNSSRQGYGLGLSIVQRLVWLLGLKLEVHSQVGKGSVFALELPLGQVATADPTQRATSPQTSPQSVAPTDYHLSNGETGTQVICALRQDLGQQLKAILITGDTSSALQELQRDERLRLARKPIHAEDLLMMLKSLLAA